MNRKVKWLVVLGSIALVCGVLGIIAYKSGRKAINEFFYPPAPTMPPVVEATTDELLKELEIQLRERMPELANALNPGLSAAEITTLETKGGFKLSEDLRTFYRWHNGMGTNGWPGIIPGHGFPPLQRIVEEKVILHKGIKSATLLQKGASAIFAGHRDSWIDVLPDGAGDGYYYDPKRNDNEGAFFYCMAEAGLYVYFPSFKNFMAATVDCFKQNVYHPTQDGSDFEQDEDDFEAANKIAEKYGVTVEPEVY